MAKTVSFYTPEAQQKLGDIQRQMLMAQMLMGAKPAQREQTRIVPRESPLVSLLPAIQNVLGAYTMSKGMKAEEALKQEEYAKLLEKMGAGGVSTPGYGGPAAQGTGGPVKTELNPYGIDPSAAAQAYAADPAKYAEALMQAERPTELSRNIESAGFTPEQRTQAYAKALLPSAGGDNRGDYQPGDYTPQSWAQFVQSGDPAVLERYVTPRQEYSPSYQRIERVNPDGSTQVGIFNTRTGEERWDKAVVPPGQKKRVDAQAAAEGEAAGAQTAKAPAAASMDYVLNEMERQFEHTMQGGVGGVFGKAGSVFDYKDKQRFENLREQLSTELRTVYRIPGEGTLSDREQAQYGVQLPSTDNHPDVNRAIVRDLRERTRLRLQTPIAPATPSAGQPDIKSLLDKYAPQ